MDKLSFEELNITKFSLSQLEILERSEVKCSVLIPLQRQANYWESLSCCGVEQTSVQYFHLGNVTVKRPNPHRIQSHYTQFARMVKGSGMLIGSEVTTNMLSNISGHTGCRVRSEFPSISPYPLSVSGITNSIT